MVRHIVRMLFYCDNIRIIPLSAILGAILLLWADIAVRTLMAPEDIAIGIVTGLVGGAFFIWLLGKKYAILGSVAKIYLLPLYEKSLVGLA